MKTDGAPPGAAPDEAAAATERAEQARERIALLGTLAAGVTHESSAAQRRTRSAGGEVLSMGGFVDVGGVGAEQGGVEGDEGHGLGRGAHERAGRAAREVPAAQELELPEPYGAV